jgi:ssDNA-binding Zn-finger/Zn-ribbon topoisomerase 1
VLQPCETVVKTGCAPCIELEKTKKDEVDDRECPTCRCNALMKARDEGA